MLRLCAMPTCGMTMLASAYWSALGVSPSPSLPKRRATGSVRSAW